MQIYIVKNKYNLDNVFFLPCPDNKQSYKSKYIKLLYSDKLISLNGIFIPLYLNIINTQLNYTSTEIRFDNNYTNLIQLETDLLKKYNSNKEIKYNLKTIFTDKIIILKNFGENIISERLKCILKISGIWENKDIIGLSYKIIPITHQ